MGNCVVPSLNFLSMKGPEGSSLLLLCLLTILIMFVELSSELSWIEFIMHSVNQKQANTLDIEQVRKMLHTYSSSWYIAAN
jgi:hypothetical protein